ncbi:Protein Smaug [Aphelenchoides fujianensis]|nr:Protein Smaug [Aphelenchoides fujianensis]
MNTPMHQSHSFMPVWHTYAPPQAPPFAPQPLLQKPPPGVYGASLLPAQQKSAGSRRFSAGGVQPAAFPPVDRRPKTNYRNPPFGASTNNGGLYQPPRGNGPRAPALFAPNAPSYAGRGSFTQPPRGLQAPKPAVFNAVGPFQPGMKDVPLWLKGLRLHKYTPLFQNMTYEEMMSLNDQRLEQRQVTKGARKKILQSLLKLRDRSQLIRQLETCIDEHGDVRCLIVELRGMMNTPIPIYTPREEIKPSNYMIDAIGIPALEVSDENLPGHIARLCMRLHDYLFQNGQPQLQQMGLEDEYVVKLLQIYDKLIDNEAFTYRQKYCIFECRRVLLRYAQERCIVPPHAFLATPPALMQRPVDAPLNGGAGVQQFRRNSDPRESDDLLATATTNATSSAAHSEEDVFKSPQGFRSTHSAPNSPMPEAAAINSAGHGAVGGESPRTSPAHTQTSSSAHSSAALHENCWAPLPPTAANAAAQFGPPPGFQPLPPMQQPQCLWTTNDASSTSSLNSLNGGLPPTSSGQQWEPKSVRSPPFKRAEDIDAEKASITAILESNPALYQHVLNYIQQQNGQKMNHFHSAQQPPKMPVQPHQPAAFRPPPQHAAPAFVPSRPSFELPPNGGAELNACGGPLTPAEKLQFISESAGASSEILDIAIRLSMCRLKEKQQRETPFAPQRAWQQQTEPTKRSTPTQTAPLLPSTWWTNAPTAPKQPAAFPPVQQKTTRNFFDEHQLIGLPPAAAEPKPDFFNPWHDTKPAAVSHLPTGGLRTLPSTNGTGESTNTLGKMLNDCFAGGPKPQAAQTTSEWLMQQYGTDPSSAWSSEIFGHSTDAAAQQHPPHFGPHFRPLPCSASGAVH